MDQEKDIGVIVDSQLKFHSHISDKVNKANNVMGIIRRSFSHLDDEMFLKLYKALVRPHLEYAAVVWSPYYKKYIKEVENVQRRATRQIPGMSDLPYEERLRKLDLPTLVYRRARGDMIETYKIISEIYDTKVSSLLTLHNDQIQSNRSLRGHTKKLFKFRSKLNIRKNFYSNRIVNLWNNLPQSVVDSPSLNSFKNILDNFRQNHPAKYDYKKEVLPQTSRNTLRNERRRDLDLEAQA